MPLHWESYILSKCYHSGLQQTSLTLDIDVFMQGGTQHRVEKAEILEHTVLFLQNTAKEDSTRAGGGGGGGGQKHSFQDGISTCLQRAAHFLGPEGKGLWLGAALDASFSSRFSRSDSDSAGVQRRTEAHSSSSSHAKSILRMLRQKSKHRLHTRASGVNSFAHPYQVPVQHGLLRIPQQAQSQNQLEVRVERRASKQSPSQSCPVSHTLWRPWPLSPGSDL